MVYTFFTVLRLSVSCPNTQHRRLGYIFWFDLSPLTLPALEALLATYVTVCMAVRLIYERKPHHYDKVDTRRGELYIT
jgi:hypothetical protein